MSHKTGSLDCNLRVLNGMIQQNDSSLSAAKYCGKRRLHLYGGVSHKVYISGVNFDSFLSVSCESAAASPSKWTA